MRKAPDKQVNNKVIRNEKGQIIKGTANPHGRPRGKTIKEMVRKYLEEHPEDMKGFVEHFVRKNRELAWQMMEGRPKESVGHSGEINIGRLLDEIEKNE